MYVPVRIRDDADRLDATKAYFVGDDSTPRQCFVRTSKYTKSPENNPTIIEAPGGFLVHVMFHDGPLSSINKDDPNFDMVYQTRYIHSTKLLLNVRGIPRRVANKLRYSLHTSCNAEFNH
jgi:hypothetical protein